MKRYVSGLVKSILQLSMSVRLKAQSKIIETPMMLPAGSIESVIVFRIFTIHLLSNKYIKKLDKS